MQGTLNEIDMRSIFQLVELGQRTGELLVNPHPTKNYLHTSLQQSARLVFFINGQIAYATDAQNSNSLARLRDYLRRYRLETALQELVEDQAFHLPEYACLWSLLEKHLLTPVQCHQIVQSMVQETLFDLLSLHQGTFFFEMANALAPQLTTLPISPVLLHLVKQVQEWKQMLPQIFSPEQCPLIIHGEAIQRTLPSKAYQNLIHWTDGKTTLRQLARYLNRDLVAIARAIYPYIEQGWVQLQHPVLGEFPHPGADKMPLHIACVDDDVVIGKTIEAYLAHPQRRITIITDPRDCLATLVNDPPDLIFCDINMPYLDGYEVCALLRQVTRFQDLPIIILTSNDGFLDRVRARIAGATDYMAKPFQEKELVLLLQTHLDLAV